MLQTIPHLGFIQRGDPVAYRVLGQYYVLHVVMHVSLKFLSSYSVENIPDTSPSEVGQYTYKFSPCTPIACKTGDTPDGVVSLHCTVLAEIIGREFTVGVKKLFP